MDNELERLVDNELEGLVDNERETGGVSGGNNGEDPGFTMTAVASRLSKSEGASVGSSLVLVFVKD